MTDSTERHSPHKQAPRSSLLKNVLSGVIGVQREADQKGSLAEIDVGTVALKVVVGLLLLVLFVLLLAL